MICRVLDIETIPDESVWRRGRPKYELAAGRQVVSPDRVGGRMICEPRVVEKDDFPPPHACRVVAVSWVDVVFDVGGEPRYRYKDCYTSCRWSVPPFCVDADQAERQLLDDFRSSMADAQSVQLITWNGRTFDLPVLAMRSLRLRLDARWYYDNRDVRYRYSTDGHLDLMDYLCDYGATRYGKLDDFAKLVGLPGKTDTSGADVARLHDEARATPAVDEEVRARVSRYCLQDSLQTAVLWMRVLHLRGKLTPLEHDAALATFRDSPTVRGAIDLSWDRLMLCGKEVRS